jgi:hypothetical protein
MTDIDLEYTPILTLISRPTRDTPEAALETAFGSLIQRGWGNVPYGYGVTFAVEQFLAAMPGWTLVPNGSADWDNGYREGYAAAEAKMGDAAFVSATTRADAAEATIARLRAALKRHGVHSPYCAWTRGGEDCDCGLRAALAEGDER